MESNYVLLLLIKISEIFISDLKAAQFYFPDWDLTLKTYNQFIKYDVFYKPINSEITGRVKLSLSNT